MAITHPWTDTPCTQSECEQAVIRYRDNEPAARLWAERACHERFVDGKASALVADICPKCHGVSPGSAAGEGAVPAIRDSAGRFVKGSGRRYNLCRCLDGKRVDALELFEHHGLGNVMSGVVENPTGARQD